MRESRGAEPQLPFLTLQRVLEVLSEVYGHRLPRSARERTPFPQPALEAGVGPTEPQHLCCDLHSRV